LQAYTVEQVAKMLHIGRDKVYQLLRTGQLRSIKIGKLRRITEEQLTEFIASLEDAALRATVLLIALIAALSS
jgi:excisionase family DNA binding protein